MKDELTLKDLYRFLVDNIKIIISTVAVTSIMAIVFAVLSNLDLDDSETVDTTPIENPRLISEKRYEEYAQWPVELFSEPQIRQMQAYLLPKAYKITFYAEHEDYEPITNTTFMREVFRNNDVLNYIEDNLNADLTPDIDFAVHIENLANSGVYELHFQRGTQEESLELAYIVMDAIEEGVIPVLENKNVYFVEDEPELVEEDYSNFEEDTTVESGFSIGSFIRDIVLFGIIGIAAGTVIGIIIALLGIIMSKQVTALYDYVRKDTDKVVRLNHLRNVGPEERMQKGLTNINTPLVNTKILLYDEETENEWTELFGHFKSNISKYKDFSNINEELRNIDEIIILSKVNRTSKDWYNNQRVQLNGYNIPIKIIQF
ncbi:hypothetical protein AB4027_04445 [Alkalibacterium putridalgicola]|uniref:hypothetical protein n=1 Tax=Alkalibacterium putridalgicola TaxID=426703 RepID=UPI0034CFBE64